MSLLNECVWVVFHGKHFAWRQRALILRDFYPGLLPKSHYVVLENGRAADPSESPKCAGCDKTPPVDELIVAHTDGRSHWLEEVRSGKKPWPTAMTDPSTCWWCNAPGDLEHEDPPVCKPCAANLRRKD